ncbi:DUF1178 family protein [Ideonella sp. BN130291]|uniref:DUF1178 family protein n=1 Tax=Ideonella sp. BN130291 TaxID=3112940 RepID=UPI002E26C472|nr:DUF1178 family protein [Ideonella sp. BN130291]
MKVLNLQCANGHGFEGWFASEDDYQSQNGRALVECPLCADRVISRLPSAPRLNLSGAKAPALPSTAPKEASVAPAGAAAAPQAPPTPAEMQALWLKAVRHVMANTEDVGERFADEARRIHYGEAEQRGIRGQATPEDAEALLEEGIEVAALPLPKALKEPLQ